MNQQTSSTNQPPPSGRPGRPRAADPGIRLSTYLPSSEYDRLTRVALREGMSLSTLVRYLLLLDLQP